MPIFRQAGLVQSLSTPPLPFPYQWSGNAIWLRGAVAKRPHHELVIIPALPRLEEGARAGVAETPAEILYLRWCARDKEKGSCQLFQR